MYVNVQSVIFQHVLIGLIQGLRGAEVMSGFWDFMDFGLFGVRGLM